MICTLLAVVYFGGYAAIRFKCESYGTTVVVPDYIVSNIGKRTPLYTFYKPLFFIERLITKNQFTWSPWAVPYL